MNECAAQREAATPSNNALSRGNDKLKRLDPLLLILLRLRFELKVVQPVLRVDSEGKVRVLSIAVRRVDAAARKLERTGLLLRTLLLVPHELALGSVAHKMAGGEGGRRGVEGARSAVSRGAKHPGIWPRLREAVPPQRGARAQRIQRRGTR